MGSSGDKVSLCSVATWSWWWMVLVSGSLVGVLVITQLSGGVVSAVTSCRVCLASGSGAGCSSG